MRDSIVICPVYNEASTLASFYASVRRFYKGDILFIDDGSSDDSSFIIDGIDDAKKKFISFLERKGYGAVLLQGFRFALKAGYEKIFTIDTDLQHNPFHLPAFIEKLNYSDVILGSRYTGAARGIGEDVPRERLAINRQVSRLIDILFDFQFSDPFCGFRGYKRSFLERANLNENSYGFALEVLMEIIRLKASFCELPVEVIYRDKNRKFLDGLNDAGRRLFYYLDIILEKYEVIKEEKETNLDRQPSSR